MRPCGEQFSGDLRKGKSNRQTPLSPQTPRGLRHKPAYAGRCGGKSASLKCGRNLRFPHKRPLPKMRLFLGVVGHRVVRRIFFHRGLSPLCGGGFLRCRSKNLLLSPLEVLGRCLSACRVFYFPQPFFPGVAKELPAARRFFKKKGG